MQGTRPDERDATDTPLTRPLRGPAAASLESGKSRGDGRRQGCRARSWRSLKTITCRLSRVKGKSVNPANEFRSGERRPCSRSGMEHETPHVAVGSCSIGARTAQFVPPARRESRASPCPTLGPEGFGQSPELSRSGQTPHPSPVPPRRRWSAPRRAQEAHRAPCRPPRYPQGPRPCVGLPRSARAACKRPALPPG